MIRTLADVRVAKSTPGLYLQGSRPVTSSLRDSTLYVPRDAITPMTLWLRERAVGVFTDDNDVEFDAIDVTPEILHRLMTDVSSRDPLIQSKDYFDDMSMSELLLHIAKLVQHRGTYNRVFGLSVSDLFLSLVQSLGDDLSLRKAGYVTAEAAGGGLIRMLTRYVFGETKEAIRLISRLADARVIVGRTTGDSKEFQILSLTAGCRSPDHFSVARPHEVRKLRWSQTENHSLLRFVASTSTSAPDAGTHEMTHMLLPGPGRLYCPEKHVKAMAAVLSKSLTPHMLVYNPSRHFSVSELSRAALRECLPFLSKAFFSSLMLDLRLGEACITVPHAAVLWFRIAEIDSDIDASKFLRGLSTVTGFTRMEIVQDPISRVSECLVGIGLSLSPSSDPSLLDGDSGDAWPSKAVLQVSSAVPSQPADWKVAFGWYDLLDALDSDELRLSWTEDDILLSQAPPPTRINCRVAKTRTVAKLKSHIGANNMATVNAVQVMCDNLIGPVDIEFLPVRAALSPEAQITFGALNVPNLKRHLIVPLMVHPLWESSGQLARLAIAKVVTWTADPAVLTHLGRAYLLSAAGSYVVPTDGLLPIATEPGVFVLNDACRKRLLALYSDATPCWRVSVDPAFDPNFFQLTFNSCPLLGKLIMKVATHEHGTLTFLSFFPPFTESAYGRVSNRAVRGSHMTLRAVQNRNANGGFLPDRHTLTKPVLALSHALVPYLAGSRFTPTDVARAIISEPDLSSLLLARTAQASHYSNPRQSEYRIPSVWVSDCLTVSMPCYVLTTIPMLFADNVGATVMPLSGTWELSLSTWAHDEFVNIATLPSALVASDSGPMRIHVYNSNFDCSNVIGAACHALSNSRYRGGMLRIHDLHMLILRLTLESPDRAGMITRSQVSNAKRVKSSDVGSFAEKAAALGCEFGCMLVSLTGSDLRSDYSGSSMRPSTRAQDSKAGVVSRDKLIRSGPALWGFSNSLYT